MTTLLLSDRRDADCVRCCQSTARVRLVVRFRAWGLDAALAEGVSPDSSAPLSLRAHALISARTRNALSREIRQILGKANQPRSPFDPTVPICRRKVRNARAALDELAARLQGPGPVEARGIAQVRLLLTHSSSPLYSHPLADDLRDSIQAAIDGLQPRL